MKENLQKISDVCKLIFGYGIEIVLFAGGLTFFGYVRADHRRRNGRSDLQMDL